jgi:hypothetical protein
MKNNKVVELAEATYHELGKEEEGDNFSMKQAKAFAVEVGGTIRIIGTHGDVYELLESLSNRKLLATDVAVGVETCGWACPIKEGVDDDEQIAPSQHPDRRRVRLISLVTRKYEMASAMGFADTPDEVITDDGSARGTLAEELMATVMTMVVASE